MVTTVRVNESTLVMLGELKEELKARSFDEVIRDLIALRKKKVSLFGADPNLPKWDEREDRAKFRGK
jgi:predicted CopG family antitoxin